MKLLLPCFLWFCFIPGLAQDALPPVSLADVTARTYPADTNAVAVILSDFCEMRLADNDVSGFEYKRSLRIKILKESGYRWADVTIPYFSNGYRGREFVRKIKGRTFNAAESGGIRVTPLTDEGVFEEKRNEEEYVKHFTLPDVREGSVIEYSYSFLSEFVYLEDWIFQREIPVVRSECRLLLGVEYPYKITLLSPFPLAEEEAKSTGLGIRYRWAMTNIPAFQTEPYTASIRDNLARIQFRSARQDGGYNKTWEELDRQLTEHRSFGKAIASIDFFKETGKTPASAVSRHVSPRECRTQPDQAADGMGRDVQPLVERPPGRFQPSERRLFRH